MRLLLGLLLLLWLWLWLFGDGRRRLREIVECKDAGFINPVWLLGLLLLELLVCRHSSSRLLLHGIDWLLLLLLLLLRLLRLLGLLVHVWRREGWHGIMVLEGEW